MSDHQAKAVAAARLLHEAHGRGPLAKLRIYSRLSGPGWLQSALTLGGGTLASSLYLGVLSGFTLLWLQPLAMALGIVMLSAIGYVSLSSSERPFQAINRHINPVLGWAWAAAALATCMVWVMPQYSLATAVMQQSLLPQVFGADGLTGDGAGKVIVVAIIFLIATIVTWNYGRGGWGVRLYELMLKVTVMAIVLCFAGVVIRLAVAGEGMDWAAVLAGFIPNPRAIFAPSASMLPLLEAVPPEVRGYWENLLIGRQRDVAIAAAAATVGINATFLFAYSIRRHGWGREYRGFIKFDLATGMLIPFLFVTAFVVIAAAHQFHTVAQPGLLEAEGSVAGASPRQQKEYHDLLRGRVVQEAALSVALLGDGDLGAIDAEAAELSDSEKRLAATLVTRDAFDLAASLRPFTGDFFGRIIFSLGVIGMALSSITLHMLISGTVICEVLGRPHSGWTFRIGSLAAATGVLGPFLWSRAAFWLAIPTSIFALTLLPIAFIAFFLMMNQRKILGQECPTGARRWAWNLAMGIVVLIFTSASLYVIWSKASVGGLALVAALLVAAGVAHLLRPSSGKTTPAPPGGSGGDEVDAAPTPAESPPGSGGKV